MLGNRRYRLPENCEEDRSGRELPIRQSVFDYAFEPLPKADSRGFQGDRLAGKFESLSNIGAPFRVSADSVTVARNIPNPVVTVGNPGHSVGRKSVIRCQRTESIRQWPTRRLPYMVLPPFCLRELIPQFTERARTWDRPAAAQANGPRRITVCGMDST